MIKGLIFDCDGTLVDSEHLFNRALSLKLTERGVDLTAAQLVARFRGVKFADVITTIEHEYSVTLDDSFIDEYRSMVNTFFKKELQACDGVIETLEKIKLPMAVASNGPLSKMKIAISVTGLSRFFNGNLFSAYQIDSWKPEPSLFLHVADQMKLRASECLVIEDSEVGIDAAIAAKMKAVLYDPNNVHQSYVDNLCGSLGDDLNEDHKSNVHKITHFHDLLTILD